MLNCKSAFKCTCLFMSVEKKGEREREREKEIDSETGREKRNQKSAGRTCCDKLALGKCTLVELGCQSSVITLSGQLCLVL